MRRTLALLAAVLAVVAGCGSADAGGEDATAPPDVGAVDTPLEPCPAQPDRPAQGAATLPPLSFDCLGGGSLDLAAAPGVPTVVNLWGSWCTPCREELPVLQQVADEAGDRVRIVGVISKDGVPQANAFVADTGVTFPSAYDRDGELMTQLGLNALPYTYFLDADGALAYTEIGPVASADELRALIAEHLGVRL